MAALKDVAAAAGVSVSTVSRVLSGAGGKCASQEVRERVWRAAKALGYSPDPTAQRLRLGGERAASGAKVIATVLARAAATESDPFFRALAQAVDQEILRQGCIAGRTLTLAQAMDKRQAQSLEADGLVVLGRCSREAVRQLRGPGRGRAIIAVGLNPAGSGELDQVLCSGRIAAQMAMDYLLSQGHTRIAYLGECSVESRYAGYLDTLSAKGLPLDRTLVLETPQTEKGGAAAAQRLLGLPELPTGLFCANDNTAIGAVRALTGAGVDIPRDMGVISIDDIEPAQTVRPHLTTIHIPKDDMGRLAVKLLLDRMSGGHSEPLRLELPCRLVRRESC